MPHRPCSFSSRPWSFLPRFAQQCYATPCCASLPHATLCSMLGFTLRYSYATGRRCDACLRAHVRSSIKILGILTPTIHLYSSPHSA